jgi:large subunit ribosomal protein L20
MVRVKRGNVARKSRKKILYLAKSYRGTHSKIFRIANEQVMKALRYSYNDRKDKKHEFRKLWIIRLNAATRTYHDMNYSSFINKIKESKILLNRKMLSQLAIVDSSTFEKLKLSLVN